MIITFEELQAFLDEQFPQGEAYGTLQKLGDGWAEMKLDVDEAHLRPGGTVSGPAMMGLADVTLYAALLSKIGLVPSQAGGPSAHLGPCHHAEGWSHHGSGRGVCLFRRRRRPCSPLHHDLLNSSKPVVPCRFVT